MADIFMEEMVAEVIPEIAGDLTENTVMANTVPAADKKKQDQLNFEIKALRWIDTVHDFFPVNASSARGEDIRDILKQYYGDDVTTYLKTKLFYPVDNNASISPSNVEVQTEQYYSKKFNTINVDNKSSVNIKSIIDKYEKEDAQTVLNGLGVSENAEEAKLQLCLTDRDFFKKEPSATSFLAEVVRRFFFKDTTDPIYFLIDATFGRLDCVFQSIDEAHTLINVLSIGDSAVTSVTDKQSKSASGSCGVSDGNNKFKRKKYLDGTNALPYNNPPEKKYNITSNEFTKEDFQMWYTDAEDKLFSKENNAAIRLFCQYLKSTTNPQETWYTEFSILKSGSPNSGASVGILKNLIQILHELTAENKEQIITKIYKYYKDNMVTQLNLAPILKGMIDAGIQKEIIIKFLFDYKRAGDHEQVNAAQYLYKIADVKANVVLLTGDRLCSLYARLMKQPCIYVHDDKYDMYRFLRELSEDDKKKNAEALLENTKKLIETKMLNYNKDDPFYDDVRAKFAQLTNNINTYLAVIKDSSDFYSKLYEFSFKGLLFKIQRMEGQARTIQADAIKLISETDSIVNIDLLNALYDTFLNNYKEIMEYLTFQDEKNPEQITIKNVAKFKSSAFGYDNITFNNIRSYFDDFKGEMKVIRESARDRDVQLAIKRNKIMSWGGGDIYESFIEDFTAFVNSCLANYGSEQQKLDDAEQEEKENKYKDQVTDIRKLIDEKLKEDLLNQTVEKDYKGIITSIQVFLLGNIPFVQPAEPHVIPMEVEVSSVPAIALSGIPSDINVDEDTQYFSQDDEIMAGGGNELIRVINKAHETILFNQKELFQDIKHAVGHSTGSVPSSKNDVFKFNLNVRLKYEYELFFGVKTTADSIEEYLEEYLKKYLENLMLSHINTLVYACFETIYALVDSDAIEDAYQIVYDYVYELMDQRYSYAMRDPYMFIYHLGKVPNTKSNAVTDLILLNKYITQLESLHESEMQEAPMQEATSKAEKEKRKSEIQAEIKRKEYTLRRRLSNAPFYKNPPRQIVKQRVDLQKLREELQQLEEESAEVKSGIPSKANPFEVISEGTESLYGPVSGLSPHIFGLKHPVKSEAGVQYVTTGDSGSKRKRNGGGKFIRTRKYIINKKAKKTRKLNKRVNRKHKKTKQQKHKAKKNTRKHYHK
jgi:hypothetical protein